MTTLIKLFYAVAIAALLILLVAFGIRSFYAAPQAPTYPTITPVLRAPDPGSPTVAPAPLPSDPAFQAEQQKYQTDYDRYVAERRDYRRNVFLVASLLGVIAVAGGLVLNGRLDAIRLGLVAGGLGVLLYAVIQAGEDLSHIGPALIFGVALIGLVLVLGVGYRWLGRSEAA